MNQFHHFTGVLYTMGVKLIADGGAYWLIDAVASYQKHDERAIAEGFQVWTLTVNDDKSALLTMTNGNSTSPIIEQRIEWTDYCETECELYLVRSDGEPPVLMLPDEY